MAKQLTAAAETISKHPGAMQLRMFQTLTEMAAEPASKIVVPVPIELLAGRNDAASVDPDLGNKITQLIGALSAGSTTPSVSVSQPEAAPPKPVAASRPGPKRLGKPTPLE